MPDCFFHFPSSKPQFTLHSDRHKPLLITTTTTTDNDHDTAAAHLHNPTAAMALIITSWLNGHRLRYFILFLCSPLLIPIVCASFPFLCFAEVCFRLCRRRRRRQKSTALRSPPPPEPPERSEIEISLLNRYLDDQLGLAIEILRECGGELGYEYDDYMEEFDGNLRRNLLC